jgi:RimJ/RimL family protein N-acetyltransferase
MWYGLDSLDSGDGWRIRSRPSGQAQHDNALTLLAGYAASIGVTLLEAHVAADNHASRRAAEAAGFTQAGTVVDDGTEIICYTRRASR